MSTYPTDKGEEPPRASFDEKPVAGALETREVAAVSVALEAAIAESKPSLVSPGMLRLWCIMGMSYLVSTMNGFDSSLMGAINAMEPYQRTFGLSGAGSSTGIVFITYNLGQIAAVRASAPFENDLRLTSLL